MIEILLNGLLACMIIPDVEEFGQCLDQVILEYNMSLEWNELADKTEACSDCIFNTLNEK